MVMDSVNQWAMRYLGLGLSAFPVRSDGSKAPVLSRGVIQQFRDRLPTPIEIGCWFTKRSKSGIGIIAGPASGNLAVIDIESEEAWHLFLLQSFASEAEHIFGGCPIVRTPSGGRHIYCRIAEHWVAGGILAKSKKGEVVIEVRGHGSYVVAPGSPNSCHEYNLPYTVERAGWLQKKCEPMLVADFERLCEIARTFNEYVPKVKKQKYADKVSDAKGKRPGDDYNRRASWSEVLEPHGWTVEHTGSGVTYWRRPGKERGVSATTGHCSTEAGGDLLYVFSSSATPLESERTYSKFDAYTFLNHDGNHAIAARELGSKGFGK